MATNSAVFDRVAVPAAVVLGCGLAALCFYPGYLSGDANWQYEQAVSGRFVDWHPVVMSWLWRQLDRVIEGPGGMFLFQVALLWLGLAISVRTFSRGVWSFVLPVLVVGLFPPVFALQSQIGKDAGMCGALLLGFGLLARAERERRATALAGSLLAFWYALAIRHNGASAVLPFALWAGFVLGRDHLPEAWRARCVSVPRRVAIGLLIFVALIGSARAASEWILGENGGRYKLYQLIPIYDVVGISVRSGKIYVPESHDQGDPWTLRQLFEIYDPHSNLWLHWKDPGPGPRLMPLFHRDEVITRLFQAWVTAISEQPGHYLRHRRDLFLAHLGIPEGTPKHTVRFGVSPDFHYPERTRFDSTSNRVVTQYLSEESDSILFRPWPYLVASALGLLFAWRTRNRHLVPIVLLVASSFCLTAPFAVIGVASDFRYLWWVVVAALVQVVATFDGLGAGSEITADAAT